MVFRHLMKGRCTMDRRGKYYVEKNGYLDYDGHVKAGEIYDFYEADDYFILSRPVTNIVTTKEDARQLGRIKYSE